MYLPSFHGKHTFQSQYISPKMWSPDNPISLNFGYGAAMMQTLLVPFVTVRSSYLHRSSGYRFLEHIETVTSLIFPIKLCMHVRHVSRQYFSQMSSLRCGQILSKAASSPKTGAVLHVARERDAVFLFLFGEGRVKRARRAVNRSQVFPQVTPFQLTWYADPCEFPSSCLYLVDLLVNWIREWIVVKSGS